MARSILVLCVVLSILVQMNFAADSSSVSTHIQNQMQQMMQTTQTNVKQLADGAQKEIAIIGDQLKLDTVVQQVSQLEQQVETLVSQVQSLATTPIQSEVKTVKEAVNQLAGAVGDIIGSLQGLLKALLDVVAQLLKAVGSILNIVGNALQSLVQNVTGTLLSVVDTVGKLSDGLAKGLDGTLKKIFDTVTGSLNNILDILDQNGITPITELADNAVLTLAKVLYSIADIGNNLNAALMKSLATVGKLLGEIGTTLGNIIKNVVGGLTATINSVLQCTQCLGSPITGAGRRRRSYIHY